MVEQITDRNLEEGLHTLFIYINDVTTGLFINGLLFAIWCIVSFGIYFNQKRETGSGDYPVAVTVAGIVTSITTILLKLVPGLVSNVTLGIVLIITLLSLLWLMFSRD